MTDEEIRKIIRDEFQEFLASDRYIFHKLVQFLDGRNIQTGRTTGTKIATEGGSTGQKIGFWSKTPTTQPSTISNPSGGDPQDAEARTAINSILTALRNIGLIQT